MHYYIATSPSSNACTDIITVGQKLNKRNEVKSEKKAPKSAGYVQASTNAEDNTLLNCQAVSMLAKKLARR
jgi:hypothetical protein